MQTLVFILALTPLAALGASAPNRPPTLVVGVDGMTFDVLDPLLHRGELPNFAALLRQGTRGILRSEEPTRSPALWTTVATGQPRAVHRIFDFVTGSAYWPKAERGGEQRLVTSTMRQAPALWNLAGAVSRRSLVVGWLNTWPAEAIEGVMVAPYVALGQARQTSIKGKIYRDVPEQTYPREAFARLQPLVVSPNHVSEALVSKLARLPPDDSLLFEQVPLLRRYLYTLRWSIAGALTNAAIVEHELRRGPFDLIMTYFDGSDTLAHRFWLFRQPLDDIRARLAHHGIDPQAAEQLKEHFGGVVDGYYRLLDTIVGRLRRAAGAQANIVLLSDHGWGTHPSDRAIHQHVPFDGEHRLDGAFLAAGDDIRSQPSAAPLTLYDIAPTVLYLLGIEPPSTMPGRVARAIIKEGVATPNARIATRSKTQPTRQTGARQPEAPTAPFADTELERLRSLGYVQ